MSDQNPVLEAIGEINTAFQSFKSSSDETLENIFERVEQLESVRGTPQKGDGTYSPDEVEHKNVFAEWIRHPRDGAYKRRLEEAQHEMSRKAVTIGDDAQGGYALPAIIAAEVERRVTTMNPFRQVVRVQQVGSSDYAHLVSKNQAGAGWVGEGDSRSETATSDLVERKPTFGTCYAYPKCSEEALQDIFFDVEGWLVEEVSDQFAAYEATAIVSGNGTNKPTGFLTATPVTTADDASPERAAGVLQYIPMDSQSPQGIGGDDLFDLVGSFKDGYLADAASVSWVMSTATLTIIRKLKSSGGGDYLLQPSLAAGTPPTLLGYPVRTTAAMPAATADEHPIAFGNWRRGYLLADRSTIRVTVDDNITVPGQVRFYVRRRVGGTVLNHEALKVLKYADS